MKLLHDYNLNSLEEILNDLDDLAKLLTVLNTYVHEKGYDDGAEILLDRLENAANMCESDFETRLQAILAVEVPPEGQELIPELIYPDKAS